jgi:hypothetical protein
MAILVGVIGICIHDMNTVDAVMGVDDWVQTWPSPGASPPPSPPGQSKGVEPLGHPKGVEPRWVDVPPGNPQWYQPPNVNVWESPWLFTHDEDFSPETSLVILALAYGVVTIIRLTIAAVRTVTKKT